MLWPCVIILLLMVAGSIGILAVARSVENDVHRKAEISQALLQLLASEKQASEQERLLEQLADVQSAGVAYATNLATALELVRATYDSHHQVVIRIC